jgi:hypothetical protein
MQEIHQEIEAALKLSVETMKKYYDQQRLPSIEYKKGDKVYLEGLNLTMSRLMTKLSDRRYGPFTVEKKVGAAAYKLKLPARWKRIHPVFNEYLLNPAQPAQYPSQQTQEPDPPDDPEDPEAECDVEEVLEVRINGRSGKLEYLVKWDGFGHEENIWEDPEELLKCAQKVRDFYRRHPRAPRPVANLAEEMRLRPLVNITECNSIYQHVEW